MKFNEITIISTPNGENHYEWIYKKLGYNVRELHTHTTKINEIIDMFSIPLISKRFIYYLQGLYEKDEKIYNMPLEDQLEYLYENLDNILLCNVEKYPELYEYYVLSKV